MKEKNRIMAIYQVLMFMVLFGNMALAFGIAYLLGGYK